MNEHNLVELVYVFLFYLILLFTFLFVRQLLTYYSEQTMSRDYIHLSTTPVEESCIQVGHPNYSQVARQECYLFIRDLENQILKKWSDIKINLVTKSNPHDNGIYYEVVAYYDTNDKDSVDQAFFCEGDAATTWSKEAQIEIDKLYKKYKIDFQHSED